MNKLTELEQRVLSGAKDFTEDELADMGFGDVGEEIDSIEMDKGRWYQYMKTIFKIDNRYFSIKWDRGLTECQENEFHNQPVEVERHEKLVKTKVVTWEPVAHHD